MSRYSKQRPWNNRKQAYDWLREGRHSPRSIRQYPTMVLRNPSVRDRALVETVTHIWSYSDRYYKLAYTYYGDARYWWVIAWWNALPTEAEVATGQVIEIPVNIQDGLRALGAY